MHNLSRNQIEKDLFGYAIWQYSLGNRENIITWTSITPPEILRVDYLFRKFEQMPEHERLALRMSNGRILDVGAGSGTHSLYLQSKGKEVYALDRSFFACKAMENRGVENIINGDFFTVDVEKKFDTVLLLMNGGGIMGTLDNSAVFFHKLKSILNPDGQVLVHMSDISYVYFAYNLPLPLHKYYGEVMFYIKYSGYCGKPFPWLYLDTETFENLATQYGFKTEILMHENEGDTLVRMIKK